MRNKDKRDNRSDLDSNIDPVVKYADPTQGLDPQQQSRRDFLEGSGAAVVAGAGISALGISTAQAQSSNSAARTAISVTVNGIQHSLEVADHWTLAELLRDELDLAAIAVSVARVRF